MSNIRESMIHDKAVTAKKLKGGTSGQLPITQADGSVAYKTLSGDATIDSTGAVSVSAGSVDPNDFATVGKASTDLAANDLCYVSSTTSAGVPVFAIAKADLEGGQAVWVCTATLASGATSSSRIFRKSALSAATLNTNGWTTAGDPVYLTATGTTGNTYSKDKPAAGIQVQRAGRITVKSATVGQIAWDLTSNPSTQVAGTTEIGAQAVTLAKMARGTDGQLIIGATSADPAYQTVSGDVTINSTGVTAIGATKVTNGMLAATAVTPSKVAPVDASVAGTGTTAAIPAGAGGLMYEVQLVCTDVGGVSHTEDFTGFPFKMLVSEVLVQKTAGAGAYTYQVANGAGANYICGALATVNDQDTTGTGGLGTINDAYSTIAAGATVRVNLVKTSGVGDAIITLRGRIVT